MVAQRARDGGEVDICFQLLCYPMLDDARTSPSLATRDGLGIFDAAAVRSGWHALLGPSGGSERYASAARSTDLAGLPPTFIDVGDLDVLLDEDVAYARRLMDAGVPVELHVYPGAYHGFDMFSPEAEISKQATATQVAAFRRAFATVGAVG